jgi:hypothetical protein
MRITAVILILALSWIIPAAQAEVGSHDYMSEVSNYTEEEETSTEEWTPMYPWQPSPGAKEPTTERETYRDVCTGFIEGTAGLL